MTDIAVPGGVIRIGRVGRFFREMTPYRAVVTILAGLILARSGYAQLRSDPR